MRMKDFVVFSLSLTRQDLPNILTNRQKRKVGQLDVKRSPLAQPYSRVSLVHGVYYISCGRWALVDRSYIILLSTYFGGESLGSCLLLSFLLLSTSYVRC